MNWDLQVVSDKLYFWYVPREKNRTGTTIWKMVIQPFMDLMVGKRSILKMMLLKSGQLLTTGLKGFWSIYPQYTNGNAFWSTLFFGLFWVIMGLIKKIFFMICRSMKQKLILIIFMSWHKNFILFLREIQFCLEMLLDPVKKNLFLTLKFLTTKQKTGF